MHERVLGMRIWHPIPPLCLDTKRLVAEHNELHIILTCLTDSSKRGWRNHPETKRWRGHAPALVRRHDILIEEAARRGLPMGTNHKTPAPTIEGLAEWPETWEPIETMRAKLAGKRGTQNEKQL
jgi:hypothetical protein